MSSFLLIYKHLRNSKLETCIVENTLSIPEPEMKSIDDSILTSFPHDRCRRIEKGGFQSVNASRNPQDRMWKTFWRISEVEDA